MKIFFVIQSLKNRAGSERVACLLANLFVNQLGYNVSIITRFSNKIDSAYELDDKVNVHKIEGNPIHFYLQLQKLINLSNPDFIVSHNMGKLSLLCSLLLKNKCDYKLYSLEHVSFSSRSFIIKFLTRVLYFRFDNIITLTDKDKESFSFCRTVTLIRNISPYSISENVKSNNKNNIIAIGRLSKQKNFIALLQAWMKTYKSLSNWELNIYGKGELEHDLQYFIEEKKLERVNLQGESNNIFEIYQDASFIVMSSLYEGLPMVLIEAQSFGLPIISFDCPYGPSEIIANNKDGILVEDQNIDKLAEAIFYLASNPDVISIYSINALESAKRFSKDIILEQWKKLFENNLVKENV